MKPSPWSVGVLGMLGATAVLNSLVLYFAQSSAVSRVDDSPYERGLNYLQEQERLALPVRQGWAGEVLTSELEGEEKRVTLILRKGGDPLGNGRVLVHIKRSDTEDDDRSVECPEVVPGEYRCIFTSPRSGLFHFVFDLQVDGLRGEVRRSALFRPEKPG